MRMKDLVEASGLPRTAIHHYQREGLLPPGRKTATNAATYGDEHVERLRLIQALRTDEMGPFSLDRVRRIIAMIEGGVAPELATALHNLPGALRPQGERGKAARSMTLSELARAAGLSLGTARQLVEADLIVGTGDAGDGRSYDEADVAIARLLAGFLDIDEIRLADLEPIAELAAETERYERALIGLATARMEPQAAEERRYSMYRSLHALHAYLYIRMTESAATASA
jgi:DNA-binding transcriptional MerR regulator